MPEPHNPSYVDVHVGARLRMRRKLLGVSQERLAGQLGLTFQQVQKYERGTNRISASKLYTAAQALQVPVAFFFDGLADPLAAGGTANPTLSQVTALLRMPEGVELMRHFPMIPTRARRRSVLDLMRALTDDETDAEAA